MTDEAAQESAPEPKQKLSLKQRLKKLMEQYGRVAVYTYLALSLSAIAGFSIAIGMSMDANTTGGVLGAIGAGWVAAKATMPLRILATLGLTPLIAALLSRRKKARGDDDDDDDDEDLDDEEDVKDDKDVKDVKDDKDDAGEKKPAA